MIAHEVVYSTQAIEQFIVIIQNAWTSLLVGRNDLILNHHKIFTQHFINIKKLGHENVNELHLLTQFYMSYIRLFIFTCRTLLMTLMITLNLFSIHVIINHEILLPFTSRFYVDLYI